MAISAPTPVDVVVIGAGQAGLSASYHLRRRGFVPLSDAQTTDAAPATERTFITLDQNAHPGGAWQHRWQSLKMATVNGIHELPGYEVPDADPQTASRDALPPYFAAYEAAFDLRVHRPITTTSVSRTDDDPRGRLRVDSDRDDYVANFVINATGTWTHPFIPRIPGQEHFRGRQLHVADYVSREEFANQKVVIVGAGISAVQLLDEISHVAETFWVTRTEPRFLEGEFDEASRLAAIDGIERRVSEGYPPGSVISVTGQYWTPWALSARDRGVLVRHPMFERVEERGVRMPGGHIEPADVILYATGFRPAIRHLAPLHLRTEYGGIRASHGRSLDEPRLFLLGYGPSASTIGANRAGRVAVRDIVSELDARQAATDLPDRAIG